MFYHSHPSIFDFIGKLKAVQTKKYVKDLASKTTIPPANRKQECQDNLREIHQDYIYVETDRQSMLKQKLCFVEKKVVLLYAQKVCIRMGCANEKFEKVVQTYCVRVYN